MIATKFVAIAERFKTETLDKATQNADLWQEVFHTVFPEPLNADDDDAYRIAKKEYNYVYFKISQLIAHGAFLDAAEMLMPPGWTIRSIDTAINEDYDVTIWYASAQRLSLGDRQRISSFGPTEANVRGAVAMLAWAAMYS
jgi:hypothetical protein